MPALRLVIGPAISAFKRRAENIRFASVLDFCYRTRYYLMTGKIRRGNYIFVTWTGDHPPRHVHVYRDSKLIVKWDLENQVAMKGRVNRRILNLIDELEREGRR